MKYISCRSKSEEDDFSPRDNVPAEKKLSGSKKGPEVEQIIESVQMFHLQIDQGRGHLLGGATKSLVAFQQA